VALAVTICLPNFLWEWNRGFESLEFLRFLHERDVQTGVTGGFFVGQLELMMLALPLAAAGLWFYFAGEKAPASLRASGQAEGGRYKKARYRALGWMYVVALALLVVLRGRDYYLAPAYPMLYAAGAVWAEKKIASNEVKKQRSNDGVGIQDVSALATQRSTEESAPTARLGNRGLQRWVRKAVWAALVADVLVASAVALPIAPVNSSWWKMASRVDIVFPEEIGWEEFTECVAQVWQGLSPEERARAGILAGNYGEVGALNLYGERWGLPRAMSGVNSSWERGYGDPAVETLVVVGYPREFLVEHFASCQVSGRVWNKYGVVNEETTEDAEIYVCRGRKGSWEQFWRAAKRYA
jgi:hypothetical protein